MGQYYMLINYSKKEFVDPWKIGGGAKLWEWCANYQEAGIIPFLLRKSNEGGGGDIKKAYKTAGHWAKDKIALVGDYDLSGDWDMGKKNFTDISEAVKKDFQHFIKH
jgi:hypothetical protein